MDAKYNEQRDVEYNAHEPQLLRMREVVVMMDEMVDEDIRVVMDERI